MIKFVNDLRQTDRWFSLGDPGSSTYKVDLHNIAEILLKVALSTINQTTNQAFLVCFTATAN
jgi:hypothetical protein